MTMPPLLAISTSLSGTAMTAREQRNDDVSNAMTHNNPRLEQLRQKAMQALSESHSAEQIVLLQDLQIYQAELELQNQELAESQQRLALQRRHFQLLYDLVPLPIVTIDSNGIIQDSNHASCQLLQHQGALRGKSLYRFFTQEDSHWLYQTLLLRSDEVVTSPALQMRQLSRMLIMSVIHTAQIPNDEGGFIVVLEDQTEEIRARHSRRMLDAFVDHGLALVTCLTPSGNIEHLSSHLRELLDVDDNYLGKDVNQIFPDNVCDVLLQQLQKVIASQQTSSFTVAINNGAQRHFSGRALPPDPATGCVSIFLYDVTDQYESDEQLRLAMRVFSEGHEGIIVTNADQHIMMVNRAFEAITGYCFEEVQGCTPAILSSGLQSQEFYQQLWQQLNQTGSWAGEITNRRKDGSLYPQWLQISSVVTSGGDISHYIAVFSDISERKRKEEQIRQLAFYDPLTGCANRNLLEDRIIHAITSSQRHQRVFAVLFIDLDHFKDINDIYGHDIGDVVLKQAAQRIRAEVRESDTVCRFGGDEFVVLMPEMSDYDAHIKAKDILGRLSLPLNFPSYQLKPSASIGITSYPKDGSTYAELMRKADIAMYQAKHSGRETTAVFDEQLALQYERSVMVDTGLRQALQDDEVYVAYQPQIDLRDGSVVGVEALVRWHSAKLGRITPSEFIPIAERSQVIESIGLFVLNTALRDIGRLNRRLNQQLHLSVNVSSRQFWHSQFLLHLHHQLNTEGFPANLLTLELTESLAMENPERASLVMRAIQSAGIGLSIDDFGTGYSSLAYLKALPFDTLKIDRSFVKDIGVKDDDEAICKAVISLADTLGKRTIAEGVELQQQADFLTQQQCHFAQGFLYSQALAIDELEAFVAERTAS
ncbi:hypothetical protein CHH28_15715 [Bacterioplanes sanyensis]|uniref:GGDEF domain-containing protein n=1 Tax=Bacterioplanes sanyensis TaxID=1249553 RepID=A0A222FNR5_9GAMM|nr:EAL domain-containing protein [Bacterioplanes sanyensis]ASP40031.1 hypothetical protein CHH28_15715 [Bacterioplanes sanyensis]